MNSEYMDAMLGFEVPQGMTAQQIFAIQQQNELRAVEEAYREVQIKQKTLDRQDGMSLGQLLQVSRDKRVQRTSRDAQGMSPRGETPDLLGAFASAKVPNPVITESYYAEPPKLPETMRR